MSQRIKIKDGRPSDYFRIGNDVVDCEQLDAYTGWVYTVLCRYTSVQDDTCYPSLNTLCSRTKMSKPKLIQCIAQLEKMGLLGVERRKNEGEKNDVNIYTVYGFNRVGVVNDVNHPSKPHLPPLVNDVYPNNTQLIKTHEQPLSPATQDDSAVTLPTSVDSTQETTVTDDTVTTAKVKQPKKTHPLRQRNPDKTPNAYTCAVAFFWSNKAYAQWSASERKAESFRFNKLFETGGALELLYAELDGFTPEQLSRALQIWVERHPVVPCESRPRENKLVSNISAILRQIVNTDKHQVLKIGSNLQDLIKDATPVVGTDWREHVRIAQEWKRQAEENKSNE